VNRKTLMKEVWSTDYLDDSRTLEVQICWLRREPLAEPKTRVDAYTVITTFPRACPFP
jgi:DNA-binding response OmpR family regulator